MYTQLHTFSVVWAQWIRRKIFSHHFCVLMHALCLGMMFACCMWRHCVVCFCCMHGRFGLVLLGIWSGYFWVVVILSATSTPSAEQILFQVCEYILWYQIFYASKFIDCPLSVFVWVTHAAALQSVKGTELIRDLSWLHSQHWCSNREKLSFLLFRDVVIIIFLFGLFLSHSFSLVKGFLCVRGFFPWV